MDQKIFSMGHDDGSQSLREIMTPGLPIYWQGQKHYEQARMGRVFNRREVSRYPLAVVEATRESHIVDTVKLASRFGCQIAVRAGGHSWAAWSVRNESILIDLGDFHEIALDETTGLVKVSPSTTGRLLNNILKTKGRMFPGGHCGEVAVAGFLLQGGMGWNCKNWGWSCQYIHGLDVVTADGLLIHCNETTNQELLWTAKGVGPGFPGVITRFYLQTRPATDMHFSLYSYPMSLYQPAMQWITRIAPTFDQSVEIAVTSSLMPDAGLSLNIAFTSFTDSSEHAQKALQKAEDTRPDGALHQVICHPTDLDEQYNMVLMGNPRSHRYHADNAYLKNDADIVSIMEEAFKTTSSKGYTFYMPMAPTSKKEVQGMSLSMQSDHYFAVYSCWESKESDEQHVGWVKRIMENVQIHSVGSYMGDSDFTARESKYWADESWERLKAIRKRWDPRNIFCSHLISATDRTEVLENKEIWGGSL